MDNRSVRLGQTADLYLVELAPQIARARHKVFFGQLGHTARQFRIPPAAATWPHERPLQNIDAALAAFQQHWVRRKQRQALAAANPATGHTVDKADTACRAYYRAADDLAVRQSRMRVRVARHSPGFNPG